MTILNLKIGQQARIRQIGGSGPVRQRLMDMGILPEVLVSMRRRAPLGDPIWVEANGVHIALRRAEASMINIE